MQVRFLNGAFIKIDGEAIEDFEGLAAGAITQLPILTGTNGVSFQLGAFFPRG